MGLQFLPYLGNGNYIYLSLLNLETQWRNSKSSKKTLLQEGLIRTDQESWCTRNPLYLGDKKLPSVAHADAAFSSRCTQALIRQSRGLWRDAFTGEMLYQPGLSLSAFLFCAFLRLIRVTALSLPPPCFSAPGVISCLLLSLTSHGKYAELLHTRSTLSSEAVLL